MRDLAPTRMTYAAISRRTGSTDPVALAAALAVIVLAFLATGSLEAQPVTQLGTRVERNTADTLEWEELLSVPRIGGRLTAIAVDPDDSTRVYVGTAEGTLLVSEDAGATFDEQVISTRTVVERSVALGSTVDAIAGTPGQIGTRTREYTLRADPPFASRPSTRPGFQFETLFFSLRPDFVSAETTPSTSVSVPLLLRQSVTSRERSAEPIVHVIVCRGAAFPLLVLTRRSVFASDDGGQSYIEALATPSSRVVSGRCRTDGRVARVVVGTTEGSFESSDGVTFAPVASMNGSRSVAAMSICQDGTLHVASGRRIFSQRPVDPDLLSLYATSDPSIPQTSITATSCAPDGTLAIGSNDGLRLFRDGQLAVAAPEILEGLRVRDLAWVGDDLFVVVAACPDVLRATRCIDTRLLVSRDHGVNWEETNEVSRRRSPAKVIGGSGENETLLLTSGSLWSSHPLVVPAPAHNGRDDALADELARWAALHLAETPALRDVVEHVLSRLALDEGTIDRISQVPVTRHLVPLLEARMSLRTFERDRERLTEPSGATSDEMRPKTDFVIGVQASWNWGFDLPNAYTTPEPTARDRVALQELRRQIAFAIEDGWRERMRLLERLRDGVSDPLRALLNAERVQVLEAMIESYLDGPLGTIEPLAYEAL